MAPATRSTSVNACFRQLSIRIVSHEGSARVRVGDLPCIVRLLNAANKRLLAGGSILGGLVQPRGSNRFPLIRPRRSKLNGDDRPLAVDSH